MNDLLPTGVRAVYFDAVGTLLHPEPPAAVAYAHYGRQFGSRLSDQEVRVRFAAAFRRQEEWDALHGHHTSEEREAQRWRAIVGEVLDDVADHERCYQALHSHFAQPAAWRCEPYAREVLAALRRQGLTVGMASNFDSRLRTVVAGLPELAGVETLVVSSEVGYKKPASEFFAALCARAGQSPDRLLLIGDDEENDFYGAMQAGLHARLVGPQARPGQGVKELKDILGLLGGPKG